MKQPDRASATADWASDLAQLTPADAEILCRALYTLCPHEWLDDVIYRTAVIDIVRTTVADDAAAGWLREIVEQLNALGFDRRSEDERVAALKAMEGPRAFRWLQRSAVRSLYDDPIVWGGCGYEGVEGCSDAGVRAGINDLDWLAEPDLEIDAETGR